ncbi:MAG TPA: hypothetical protein VFJ02_19355 [Vicinamibacterales bacterium]|nr:hypothetical protein [Vicinamibacterales bacterium]
MSFGSLHVHIARTAVWSKVVWIACLASLIGVSACGDIVRQGESSSYLIVNGIEGASGAEPNEFGGTLQSDVVTVVNGSPTIFNDIARVRFTLGMKDAGGAETPTSPTTNNFITIDRYNVRYFRADGRNTPGVDVPYAFDGAFTATVGASAVQVAFTVVRPQAKGEAPLAALGHNFLVISTIAEVTFYGRDQTGREVIATARMGIDFANFGDPN